MANFFAHNTIRKYTLGLLDTFNDIQVERTLADTSKQYITVPITYGSRDKAFVFSEMDVENFQKNNYNVLPRMALSLLTLNKDQKRDTNKFNKINKTINGNIVTFQYNAVSYTFTYELAIATRSMTELAMILEQILPHFNPTYNLRVKELDLQEDDTTVPVSLMSVDLDAPNNIGQDDDIRICSGTIMLDVRGSIYQPFTDASVIENVRLYLNTWDANNTISEERRSIKYEFDVANNVFVPNSGSTVDFENNDTVAKNAPVVTIINGPISVPVLTQSAYTVVFTDVDDEDTFTYIWNIISDGVGSATIISNNQNPITINALVVGTVTLQVQVMDRDNNISNIVTKLITIV